MSATQDISTQVSGTAAERMQDRALRAAIWTAHRLPYEKRVSAFGTLARTIIRPGTSYGRRMMENLDFVWPEMSENRRAEIAIQSADNSGRALIEHYSMPELAMRMADVDPIGPGLQTILEAQAAKRPVILLTGHFGNYEAIWACLTAHGAPLGGFYRPMSNPYINRHYVASVEAIGNGPLFSQDRTGMGRLLRHLKGGGGVLMLNDLYVGSGIEMEFLGKPAMTGLSAAELALRMKAPLVPVFSTRQPDGVSFVIEAEEEIPPSDPQTMTAAFNRSIEARITDEPGQWFWIHRRWKRKWNRGKGMEPGLHPAALPRRKSK